MMQEHLASPGHRTGIVATALWRGFASGAATLALVISIVGCGDEEASEGSTEPADSRLVVTCSAIFLPDGVSTLVSTTDAITTKPVLELGLQVPGIASCIASREKLFLGSGESPTITRYGLPAPGEFVDEGTVSFANLGVGPTSRVGNVVLEDKAYLIDHLTEQVIIWNPVEMTTIGSLNIEGLEPPSDHTPFPSAVVRAGDVIIAPLRYINSDDVQVARMGFAFIDTTTDTITTEVTEFCGPVTYNMQTSNGDTYFATHSGVAAYDVVGITGASKPCILRVRAGETRVDASFQADLNGLTDSNAAAGLVAGPNGGGYVVAWDESILPLPTGAQDFTEVTTALAWTLRFTPDVSSSEASATRVSGWPTGTGDLAAFQVNGVSYATVRAPDFSGGAVYDLSDPTQVELLWETSGFVVFSAFEVR